MTPIPPALAIAIAMSDSVTVSIAAEAKGTLSAIPRVNREFVVTSLGWTSECRGVSSTSSNVSTTSLLTRDNPSAASRSDPLMRESPLPDFAGEAGCFELEGRVVVAIAKSMALFGLGPEATTSAYEASVPLRAGLEFRAATARRSEFRSGEKTARRAWGILLVNRFALD